MASTGMVVGEVAVLVAVAQGVADGEVVLGGVAQGGVAADRAAVSGGMAREGVAADRAAVLGGVSQGGDVGRGSTAVISQVCVGVVGRVVAFGCRGAEGWKTSG